MKKIICLLSLMVILFASCGNKSNSDSTDKHIDKGEPVTAICSTQSTYIFEDCGEYYVCETEALVSDGQTLYGSLGNSGWFDLYMNDSEDDDDHISVNVTYHSSSLDDCKRKIGMEEQQVSQEEEEEEEDPQEVAFEEAKSKGEGRICYVGSNDYYIIYTNHYSYSIIESTASLSEGDVVYGDVDSFGLVDLYKGVGDELTSTHIEENLMSKETAFEWMGKNKKLNYYDQQSFDNAQASN